MSALLNDAAAARLDFTTVEASSFYTEGGATYPPANVKDGKSATAWFEGATGSGQGQSITVQFGAERNVQRIVVYAGQWVDADTWNQANRPKELLVKYSDGTTATWSLTDKMEPQVLAVAGGKKTSSITLEIKQIFNGTVFHDTGISEIQVYDDGPDKWAAMTSVAASSTFSGDDGASYDASAAIDGIKDTFWCEGNKAGDGVGEWIEVKFDRRTTVGSMAILNGMGSSAEVHKRGNVATGATLTFSDGSKADVALKAFFLPQTVKFPARATDSVRVAFTGVRPGTDFNDLCVSELSFLP
jgi:hypothetical protein